MATSAFPTGRRGWIGVAALTLGVFVCMLATCAMSSLPIRELPALPPAG